MGFFGKKINLYKEYSIGQAMWLLAQPEFKDIYTSEVLENGKVRIMTIEESKQLEARYRERTKAFKDSYKNKITNFKEYKKTQQDDEKIINYKDYLYERNSEREQEIG